MPPKLPVCHARLSTLDRLSQRNEIQILRKFLVVRWAFSKDLNFVGSRLRWEKLGQAERLDKEDTDTVCFGTNAVL